MPTLSWHAGAASVPKETRKRLIDAHQSGISCEQMTRLYAAKKDTAYRVCSLRKYYPKLRGGSKSSILDEDAIHYLMGNVTDIISRIIKYYQIIKVQIILGSAYWQLSLGREIISGSKIKQFV